MTHRVTRAERGRVHERAKQWGQEKWGQSNFFYLDELAWLIVTKKLL
jgi:hypothetical protein